MIGVGGSGEVLRVARVAICWRAREDVVDMAMSARNTHMSAGQRERRLAVIELGPVPRSCAVTNGAGGGDVRRDVIRIGCSGEVCLVATITIRWQRSEVVVG